MHHLRRNPTTITYYGTKIKSEAGALGPVLRLAQPGGPAGFLSSYPFFLPDYESRIQLSKRCDFIVL
jgi:hypothetical protein